MFSPSHNILMFASWYPNRVQATNGNFAEKHIRLIAQSHQVTVFQVEYDPELSFGRQEWVESRQDNYHLLTIYFGSLWGKRGRLLQRLFLCWRAFVYLRSKNTFHFLHIHVAMPGVILACFLKFFYHLPFILSCHSSGFLSYNPRVYPLWQRRFLMSCANKALAVFPVSKALKDALIENGLDTDKTTVSLIPNVVNTKIFTPILPAQNSDNQTIKILHVSNFHPQAKNVEGILDVAKILENKHFPFLLSIAGDGDLTQVKTYAKSIGLSEKHIRFYGTLQEKEVAAMMDKHHIFLLFSNYETQGVTLLEAQCMGMPIIATNVGGIPEVISENWMGVMVKAGDKEALCQAIENFEINQSPDIQQKIMDGAKKAYSEKAISIKFNVAYIETYEKINRIH